MNDGLLGALASRSWLRDADANRTEAAVFPTANGDVGRPRSDAPDQSFVSHNDNSVVFRGPGDLIFEIVLTAAAQLNLGLVRFSDVECDLSWR